MVRDISAVTAALSGERALGAADGNGKAVDKSRELADKRLKEACQQMEAVFWHFLLRSMRKTIPEGGLFEQSSEERLYLDMLDEQYAMLLAEQEKAGIGRILYEQLRQKERE